MKVEETVSVAQWVWVNVLKPVMDFPYMPHVLAIFAVVAFFMGVRDVMRHDKILAEKSEIEDERRHREMTMIKQAGFQLMAKARVEEKQAYQKVEARIDGILGTMGEINRLEITKRSLHSLMQRLERPGYGPDRDDFKLLSDNSYDWNSGAYTEDIEMHIRDVGAIWDDSENIRGLERDSLEFKNFEAPGEDKLPSVDLKARWRQHYMLIERRRKYARRCMSKVQLEIDDLRRKLPMKI